MENQTPEVITPQRSKSSPMLWVAIGVAILASGIGIGLVAGKYFQPVSSTTSVSIVPPTPILSPTVVPVEEGDPTATWKTYTNDDYGFSFRYPEKGNVQKLQKRDSLLLGGAVFKLINSSKFTSQSSEVYTYVYNRDGLSLGEWIKTNSTVKPFGSEEKEFSDYVDLGQKNIDGFDGINFRNETMGFVNHNVAVEKGDYVYVVGYVEVADDLSSEYNQILSTFKFVFLGYDLQRRTDVNAVIRPGLELYKFDHKQYPDSLNLLVPAYLITLPVDPVTKESYPYKVSVNKSDYNITVAMEDGTVLVVESPK